MMIVIKLIEIMLSVFFVSVTMLSVAAPMNKIFTK
jgi:hypothetical protein